MASGNPYRSSSAASIKGCCCCIVLLFSFLALLSLAIILIIVLAIKPKNPQFDLQQVNVQYINFASTNTLDAQTSESVSLEIQMLFIAKNDNVAGIKYRDSTFTIMYRGVPLGRGIVPGFYQAAHSVKNVKTTVSVDRVNLLQADAVDLVKDVSVNDRVELRVMGDVIAKIRIIGITSPSVQVSIDCSLVISPSKQSLVSKQCGFDGLQV
ncbi:NDR1/HIN1-like protein 13 [Rutidosis leptorrhynchoides]|uniref:NDR1/HIN1-like protein 13 n=1 Tax=Rutidosis leptorrhynchoides TaxID=125765 RepID=UPI003A99AACD